MAIPPRLVPAAPSHDELSRFARLAERIEQAVHEGDPQLDGMLAEWNQRANRSYEPSEFTTYYGAMETEEFVEDALQPRAVRDESLTFLELVQVVAAVMSAELPEPQTSYFVQWLDANLPAANASDLIFNPDHWFDDPTALQIELSPEQVALYAVQRASRTLPGEPTDVELPRADPRPPGPVIPEPPRSGGA